MKIYTEEKNMILNNLDLDEIIVQKLIKNLKKYPNGKSINLRNK